MTEVFDLGRAEVPIDLGLDDFIQDLAKARNNFGRSMRGFQEDMRIVGRRLSVALTAPIVGAFGLATKEAIAFESAFVGVQKTVEATPEQFAALKDAIQELSVNEIPQSAQDLAALAESAGQLGIQTRNILEFTRVIAMLGDTTNIMGQEGAQQLARFLNITNTAQSEIGKVASVIVELGNNMATTESEILTFALRLGGAGTAIGLTEEQIFGFAASLSSMGLRAEKAGTAFSKLFIRIANAVDQGGKELEAFAEVSGKSGDEFFRAFKETPHVAIQDFIKGLAKIRASGQNIFAVLEKLNLQEIRLRDTVLLAAAGLDKFALGQRLAAAEIEKGTALTIEAEKRYASTASQLRFLANAFRVVGETIGEVFTTQFKEIAPNLRGIGSAMLGVAESFANADPAIQKAMAGFAATLAIVGPLIFALATLSGVVLLISMGLGTTLSAAIFAGATGLVALSSAVLGATVAWKFFEKEIREIWQSLGKNFELWVVKPISEGFQGIQFMVGNALNMIGAALDKAGYNDGQFLEKMGENLMVASEAIREVGSSTSNLKPPSGFEVWVEEMKRGFKDLVSMVGNVGKHILPLESMETSAAAEFNKLMEGVVSKVNAIIEGFNDGDAAIIDTGKSTEELAKKLERLKEQAQTLRFSLFPREDMARAVKEVHELAEAFPEIIDDEAMRLAFEEIWRNFKEQGFGAFEEIGLLLAELPESVRTAFEEAGIAVKDSELLENMIKEGEELFKQALEDSRKAADLHNQQMREMESNIRLVISSLQDLARATGSKVVSGIAKVVTVMKSLNTLFKAVPSLISTLSQAMKAGFTAMRVQASTALGWIGLILEAITAIIQAFGLFGDEGEGELSRVEKSAEMLKEAFADAFKELEEQLISFVRTGKIEFADLVNTLLDDLLRVAIRGLITGPISDSIGLGLKSGGVMSKGRVLTSPTLVGRGVFAGEAGPEGVLPLTKVDGVLGVNASGMAGGTNITIIDQRSNGNPVEVNQSGDDITFTLTDKLSELISNGRLDRSLKDSFGLRRRGGVF